MKRLLALVCAVFLALAAAPRAQAEGLEVNAKSAVLMDVATGTVLYEKNAHEALAPASVTKVMTMLLIMEAIDSGALRYEDTVTATEAAAEISDHCSGQTTHTGLHEHVHLAGSESAFVDRMNARARELGMNDTNFVNCTGLDDGPDASRHRTSAYDIALMSRELLRCHPDITHFTSIWMDTVRNGTFGLSNTNKLIRFYPGATGLKTGFTSGAGYCLSASAKRDGFELIAVTMGCESSKVRNAACKAMLDYGFAGYTLCQPELSEVSPVPVRLGKTNQVLPKLGETRSLLLPKSKKAGLRQTVELSQELTAPVEQGQTIGKLCLYSGEELLLELPLVAAEEIPRLTLGEIYVRVLKRAAMAKT